MSCLYSPLSCKHTVRYVRTGHRTARTKPGCGAYLGGLADGVLSRELEVLDECCILRLHCCFTAVGELEGDVRIHVLPLRLKGSLDVRLAELPSVGVSGESRGKVLPSSATRVRLTSQRFEPLSGQSHVKTRPDPATAAIRARERGITTHYHTALPATVWDGPSGMENSKQQRIEVHAPQDSAKRL